METEACTTSWAEHASVFFTDPVGFNAGVSVCGFRHMGCWAKHYYPIMVPSLYKVLGLDVCWLPARPLHKRMGIFIVKPWLLHFIFWGTGTSYNGT